MNVSAICWFVFTTIVCDEERAHAAACGHLETKQLCALPPFFRELRLFHMSVSSLNFMNFSESNWCHCRSSSASPMPPQLTMQGFKDILKVPEQLSKLPLCWPKITYNKTKSHVKPISSQSKALHLSTHSACSLLV